MGTSKQDTIAILLVTCPDSRGIVSALAQLLYGYGANILDADQHADPVSNQFFQRIRFDESQLQTDRASLSRAIEEVAGRFQMKWSLRRPEKRKRVALFVSRYSHCLYDLLWRGQAEELRCEIALVISNHQDLAGAGEQFNIPFHHMPIDKNSQAEQEQAQLELLQRNRIDLIVLARYMRILSDTFVRCYENQIINIHHSFLPAFVGRRPYHQAHERGVKLIGATAHYATAELDQGPIIEQSVVRCSHRDSVADLVRKGRDLERTVLARAVRWHLEDRILTYGNKTVVFE